MNTFVAILIGLILGWVIEWVIDWVFWRRNGGDSPDALREAEATIDRLRSDLTIANQKLETAENESKVNRNKLADSEQTITNLRDQLNKLAASVPQRVDRLERIKGVGAVFAAKLQKAGITTFAQLAEQTPERVEEIIDPEDWQKVEPESWIAQARKLAQQQADQTKD